jgi:hypothetical protein
MVGTVQFATAAEAVLDYFRAVGIRARFRTVERATYLSAWKDKKLKNLLFCGAGGYGNAATRIENYLVTGGTFSFGGYPDVDDLFQQQARERDARQAAGTPAPDPAGHDGPRPLHPDLRPRVQQRRGAARGGVEPGADPPPLLHRPVRGHPSADGVVPRGSPLVSGTGGHPACLRRAARRGSAPVISP